MLIRKPNINIDQSLTGIFYALGTIGPAVAFLGGGYMLNYHTDIDQGISEGLVTITHIP